MIPRFLISAVFLVAGLLKIRDPLAFADGIAAFHFFPVWMINPLALSVPFFEVLTGLGILASRTRRPAALAACGLSLGFVVLFASATVRGLEVTCACFGKWELLQVSTREGFVRAIILLALCLWICAGEWRKSRKAG